tara:strand:- start:9049 stop:9936 length:888 start_codon:yes stop_codon:yes gene_type:complete
MKILITGLTGFIGKNFYRYSKYKNNILAVSNKSSILKNFQNEDINFVDCELENISNFRNQIKEFDPDCVINFAWKGLPDYSIEMSKKNLNITLDFFNFLEKNTKIKKFINTGTCAEYLNPSGKISENNLVKPYDYFSSAKISLSQKIKKRCDKFNINYINLRLFYVYGLHQRDKSLIPFLINSYKKGVIPKLSSPFSKLDYINCKDVINAVDSCLKNSIPSGDYNVGYGMATSNYKIQEIISRKFNFEFNKDIYRSGNDEINFYSDNSKLIDATGWSPKINPSTGIQNILEEDVV